MTVSAITNRRYGALALIVALAAAAALLALPASAGAQAAAAADEYIPKDPGGPSCRVAATASAAGAKDCPDDEGVLGDTGTGVPGSAGDDGSGGSDGLAASTSAGDGDSLPFTGYPLTSLVLLCVALLAAGALLRLALALYDRRSSAEAA